jgi:Helix-turn-helix domain of resolvase
MRVAKAKGHLRSKQPKLNPRQEAHLVKLLHTGEYSTAEIGDLFGVARSTVYRAVARSKASTAAGRTTATTTAPAPHAGSRPIIGNGGLATATSTYRPRHGAPSELSSENRGRSRIRTMRPASPPQTGP